MTIFQKIIDKELPATVAFENEELIVIHDIAPRAPVHLLIIPKKSYPSLQDVPKEDLSILSSCFAVAQEMAKEFSIENSYRLITNCGKEAGQSVFHLHFHLIGGKPLGPMA